MILDKEIKKLEKGCGEQISCHYSTIIICGNKETHKGRTIMGFDMTYRYELCEKCKGRLEQSKEDQQLFERKIKEIKEEIEFINDDDMKDDKLVRTGLKMAFRILNRGSSFDTSTQEVNDGD